MRQEGIEVTFKIPVEFGKPDKNGVIYTRKAVEIALDSYSSCPIVFLDNEGNKKVIGVTDEHRAELIEENGKYGVKNQEDKIIVKPQIVHNEQTL